MKMTSFTLLLIMMIFSEAIAQTEKGRWLIGAQGGNFTYRKYKNDAGYTFSGNVSPSVNYFVLKNLLIGINVLFSIEKGEIRKAQFGPRGSVNHQFGAGPSIRYYIGNSSLKPFVEVSYTFSRYVDKYHQEDSLRSHTTTSIGYRRTLAPGIGLAYFINRHVVLNAGLSYNFYQEKWKNYLIGVSNPDNSVYNYKTKSVTLGIGFAIVFGKQGI